MSEVVCFMVIFILILVVPACIRRRRELARRQAQQDIGLAQFREQQQQQRRQQGTNTAGNVATTTTPQPSAPTETETTVEERKQLVMKHLYHRTLEHGESVRNLSMILAAANDRYDDTDAQKDGMLARTWRSAETSVNKFVGNKPECSICLDRYEAKETVCWSKNDDCDHIFHQDCIVQWLADHDECPLCRTNLLQYDGSEQDV